MEMIKTQGLTRKFKEFQALSGIDVLIEEGDVYGFIGPNGAGKTTTIRVLATLLEPSSGAAFIDGINVVEEPYEIKKRVGFMPDSFGVYEGMRLREYLDFFGAAYKIPLKKRRAIIDDVLTLTDLAGKADLFVSAFSRGMKQRCCLAKTLIHDPKVLLLDEPASGLDPRARAEFKELIKTLQEMGKTILISSHILSELGDMCNKIGIISDGKMLAQGEYREILHQIRKARDLRLEVIEGADLAEKALEEDPAIEDFTRSGDEFHIQTNMGAIEISGLLTRLVESGVKVLFLEEIKGSLEDVFMHVTNGDYGN